MYGISIKIKQQFGTFMWELVKPPGGAFYSFVTKKEAENMMRMCYPDQTKEEVKVVNLDG